MGGVGDCLTILWGDCSLARGANSSGLGDREAETPWVNCSLASGLRDCDVKEALGDCSLDRGARSSAGDEAVSGLWDWTCSSCSSWRGEVGKESSPALGAKGSSSSSSRGEAVGSGVGVRASGLVCLGQEWVGDFLIIGASSSMSTGEGVLDSW